MVSKKHTTSKNCASKTQAMNKINHYSMANITNHARNACNSQIIHTLG